MTPEIKRFLIVVAITTSLLGASANANAFRETGKTVTVAGSTMSVTPPRDWNALSAKPGKHAEIWTLDGEQLNNITFYAAIEPGEALIRERSRKREPLPRFTGATLLAEVPELLEGTYRAHKRIGSFNVTNAKPQRFLNRDGVHFAYDYTDADELLRKGEGRAVVVSGKLYMITFDAPRLHFFDKSIADYRALAETARLGP